MKPFAAQTYYELLEISVSATAAEIRSACERLTRLYADEQLALYGLAEPGAAESLRKRLLEATEILTDDELRAVYDEDLGLPPRDVEPGKAAVGQLEIGGLLTGAGFSPGSTQLRVTWSAEPTPVEPLVAPVELAARRAEPSSPVEVSPSPIPPPYASPPRVPVAGVSSPIPAPHASPPSVAAAVAPSSAIPPPNASPPGVPVAAASTAELPRPNASPLDVPAPGDSGVGVGVAAPGAEESIPAPRASPAGAPLLPRASPPGLPPAPSAPSMVGLPLPSAPRPSAPLPPGVERPKPPDLPPDAEFNGELLRMVRTALGLSLAAVAERTRIGSKHLENVEADRYDALPATVYLRGILISLARELKLDGVRVSKSYLSLVERARSKG